MHFRHISNNKLKIIIDPDFEVYLKNCKQHLLYTPKDVSPQFLKWLQRCHDVFDRERYFDERDLNEEKKWNNNVSIFKRMNIDKEGETVSIVADSKKGIKLAGNSKGRKRQKGDVYGQIVHFVVQANLPSDVGTYFGNAQICYKRCPVETFGEQIEKINSDQVLSFLETHNFNLKKLEMPESLLKQMIEEGPHRLMIYAVPLPSRVDPKEHGVDNLHVVTLGTKYFKFACQIFNGQSPPKAMTSLPYLEKKLSVQLQLIDRNTKKVVPLKGGVATDLYAYDAFENDDVMITEEETDVSTAHYCFHSFVFDKLGKYTLDFRVLEGKREILERKVDVEVVPHRVYDIELKVDSDRCSIDDYLPLMVVRLVDEEGNSVAWTGRFKAKITAAHLQCVYDGMDRSLFSLEKEEEGTFMFETLWKLKRAIPKQPFLSADKPSEKTVQFKLEVFEAIDSLPLGKPKLFSLRISPGNPVKLVPMMDDDFLVCENGQCIDELRFVILDTWGQRTAPEKDEDWIGSLGEGPCTMTSPPDITSLGILVFRKIEVVLSNTNTMNHEVQVLQTILLAGEKFETVQCKLKVKVVQPLPTASAIKVFHESVAIEDQITVPAGGVLSSLTYALVDESDCVIPQHDALFARKYSGVSCSWVPKKNWRSTSTEGDLPDYVAPNSFEAEGDEMEVVCQLTGVSLKKTITVRIEAGAPTKWSFLGKHLKTVLCGEVIDFISKAQGVYLADANDLQVKTEVSTKPILTARWEGFEIRIPMIKREGIEGLIYDIDPGFAFDSWPTPGSVLELEVADVEAQFVPETCQVPVLSGLPRVLKITCPSLGLEDALSQSILINRETTVDRLTFTLFDACSNPANVALVSSLQYLVRIHRNNDNLVKKSYKSSPIDLSFSFQQHKGSSLDMWEIECGVEWKLKKERNSIDPVVFTCNYIQLHGVEQILLLTEGKESSIILRKGDALPVLQIMVVTEDKKPFTPDLASFHFEIVFDSNHKMQERIDFYDIYNEPCLEESMGHYLLNPKNIPLKAGIYMIEAQYKELRPQYLSNPSLSGICLIEYLAGAPSMVIVADDQTESLLTNLVASTSSVNRSNRTLAENIFMVIAGDIT